MSQLVTSEAVLPPYVSFANFEAFLRALSAQGVPENVGVLDLSVIPPHSRSQLRPALKYLGLIDASMRPTDDLHALVASLDTPKYPACLRKLLDVRYPQLAALDLATCAPGAIARLFSKWATSTDVARKAQRFYLSAAKEAGKEIGAKLHFGRRFRKSPAKETSRNSQALPPEIVHLRQEMIRKLPQFDAEWPIEIKLAWLKTLGKLSDAT